MLPFYTMFRICPNGGPGLYVFRFGHFWPGLYWSLAFIRAWLLLHSFEYFIHKPYLSNPYKWLPFTSVRVLYSLPRAVASAQTFYSLARYLKPPVYAISNSFGFKESRDAAPRYLDTAFIRDPATIYKQLSWTPPSKWDLGVYLSLASIWAYTVP